MGHNCRVRLEERENLEEKKKESVRVMGFGYDTVRCGAVFVFLSLSCNRRLFFVCPRVLFTRGAIPSSL